MEKPRQRLIIVDSNYPHEKNLYGDVFVHSRVKHYAKQYDTLVVGWDKNKEALHFTYEGIEAKSFTNKRDLVEAILGFKPDAVLIHFVEGWMLDGFIRDVPCPVIVWVHGIEALGWYRRLFTFKHIRQFAGYILHNTLQLRKVGKLVNYSNKTGKVSFVFVSEWMRSIMETDTFSAVRNYHIIPNPIDTTVFRYVPKQEDDRKQILLIRSFDSKKYANDLAVEAIELLSNKPFFADLRFSIYGVGKFFDPLMARLKGFPNVSVHNRFIENKQIPETHRKFGVFLCPTRQDAQGVSMCEAMSSGLAPISSYNTAIPEFLTEGETGFMTTSPQEIADRIAYLYHHPKEFLRISAQASHAIQQISGHLSVINKEFALISGQIERYRSSNGSRN